MNARSRAGVLSSMLLVACGGEPGASSAPARQEAATPVATALLRIDLGRGASGVIDVLGSSVRAPPAGAWPMPALGGDAIAVAYAGADVRDAVPIAFPTEALLEGAAPDGTPVRETVALPEGRATAFVALSDGVDRVAVITSGDEVAVPFDPAAVPKTAPAAVPRAAGRERTGEAAAAVVEGGIADAFPALAFLEPGDEDLLPDGLRAAITAIVPFDPEFDAPIAGALGELAPLARGAMTMLAVARIPPTKTGGIIQGIASGTAFVVSEDFVDDPVELVHTVVHENAHNATYLLDAAATASDGLAAWPEAVQAAARKRLEGYRLAGGLTATWKGLHGTAVDAGVAGPRYVGDAWKKVPVDKANGDGFATPYGGTSDKEDIAEYTQRIQAPSGGATALCGAIRGAGSPFPERLALPYAKAKLLEGAGLVEPGRLADCIGDTALTGPRGIHLGDKIDFTDALKAGWLDQDGGHFFAVLGEGPNTYGLLVRVLSSDEQPLGLHRLERIFLANLHEPNDAVYLKHSVPSKARASKRGLVLVTSATAERVEGAILFLELQNGFGQTTDRFPISTFLID